MTALLWPAAAALAAALGWLTWMIGGAAAVGCALLFFLATFPGIPLGFALFGRRHAAGWAAGFLLGYAMTALACWAVVFAGRASPTAFVAAWVTAVAVGWAAAHRLGRDAPATDLPAWTRAEMTSLVLVLFLVPALVGPPFLNIGTKDRTGSRLYRAYFTADFVWHTALTAELARHTQPPRNPYLAARPIHYYWTYFMVPATIAGVMPARDVQLSLKVTALWMALLFVAAIYLAAWTAVPGHPLAAAAGVALTITAASAEGLYAIVDLLRRGRPLSTLRDLNIDSITSWYFGGLRIDDLPRSMWYNPQHSAACALGLVALVIATGGARARPAAIALAGFALGASVTFNPFVGVVFFAIYGATIAIDALRQGRFRDILRHALAAIPVAAALGWCSLNQVTEGAGAALHFGMAGPGRHAPLVTLMLSAGPILAPALIGVWPARTPPLSRAAAALVGVPLSLVLLFFVTLTVDLYWVGFRAGQILFVLVPGLAARGLVVAGRAWSTTLAILLGLIVLFVGLPTTIVDVYNAQDVTNTAMGPGFHWTVKLSPAQQEALEWIRTRTPPDAVVQAEPIVRDRETWSLIPSFGERRMAAGLPISLMSVPEYRQKSEQVRAIYASADSRSAWRLAHALGIDYLYVDATERAAYPGAGKFDHSPELFERVFANDEAAVYRVRK